MQDILTNDELPDGFRYPKEHLRLFDQRLTNLYPWVLLYGDELRTTFSGLKRRYPKRVLIPIAARVDCDDVACWEIDRPGNVVVIHDFASAGFEQKREFESIWDWLKYVIDEMAEFEP